MPWILENSDYSTSQNFWNSDTITKTCDTLSCSHDCVDTGPEPYCACPIHFTIDDLEPNKCVSITSQVKFSETMIREDNTIRPFSQQDQCLYHKKYGFKERELVFIGSCIEDTGQSKNNKDRYRWSYNSTTGQIANMNYYDSNRHCMTIPDPSKYAKQQMYLAPCDESREDQKVDVINGKMKMRANHNVCIMYNLVTATRLWTVRCDDKIFSVITDQ